MTIVSISAVVDRLEQLHNSCGDQALQNLYLKFCLLECCGWIEERQDSLFLGVARLKIDESGVLRFQKEKLKRNAGFTYQNNMVPLIVDLFGRRGLERLEQYMEDRHAIVFTQMKSDLNVALKEARDPHAHTSAGLTLAPLSKLIHFSVLRPTMHRIETGFAAIEAGLMLL